jgi:hypothetical protein
MAEAQEESWLRWLCLSREAKAAEAGLAVARATEGVLAVLLSR